ncbi:MAG: diguanylate cyclase, partial [Oscillospiraceae bacterium]
MLKGLFKSWGLSIIAVFIGACIILSSLIFFNINVESITEQFIRKNMEEANQTAIASMNYSFKNFTDMLTLHANLFNNIDFTDADAIMNHLRALALDDRFERVTLIMNNGNAYSSTFGMIKLPDINAIDNLHTNHTTITGPRITETNETVIDISTPVHTNNILSGRLVATIGGGEIEKMYISNTLQGDAGLILFSQDGIVMANISSIRELPVHTGDNIFDFWQSDKLTYINSSSDESINNVKNGSSGWLKYKLNGSNVSANYEPFGINGWFLDISATDNTLDLHTRNIRNSAIILAATILLTVCAVAIIVMIQRRNEQKRIDVFKNTYSVAIRNTNDLFYEANLDSDQLTDYSKSLDKAIWQESPKKYSSAVTQIANVCFPEFKKQYLDTFLPENVIKQIKNGISSINLEYKVYDKDNTAKWMSATFVPITDLTTQSTKLICLENDITEQKKYQEQLKLYATLDGLTELYNKTTIQKYVDNFLNGEGKNGTHALFIIDIDNFKSVNDTLGHAKGDEVICTCSQLLRTIFRNSDIIGRIGGDEFAALLKNYRDID